MSKMPYHWPHLMRIVTFKHYDKHGELLEEQHDLYNMLHLGGENFILSAAFATSSVSVPVSYYLGLDNRTIIQATDTMSSLVGEPAGYGYTRQPVSSSSGWTILTQTSSVAANSPVVSFSATGGSYGPVSNLFLSTTLDNTGILVATAPLSGARILNDGDIITMQMSLSLSDSGS